MPNEHRLLYDRRGGDYLHRNSIGGITGTNRSGEGGPVEMAENGDSRFGHRHSMPSALMRIGGDKKPSSFVPFPNTTPPPTTSRYLSSTSMPSPRNQEEHSPHRLEDRRNDDVSSSHPSREGQRHIVDEERSGGTPAAAAAAAAAAAQAKTPSPRPTLPPTPPRRGGRHTSWPMPSFYRSRPNTSGPSTTDPLTAIYPRTPSPTPSRQGGISPPEPRRILCGKSLFGRDIEVTAEGRGDEGAAFPVQTRYNFGEIRRTLLEAPLPLYNHEIVGHPSLKIHRLKLPAHLLPLLDTIVSGCEMHASTLPTGWQTDLYSLTKQDIALREIPHIYNAAKPVISYIQKAACLVYGITSGIKMDRNQPHVLKYNCHKGLGHTGVELHHDKCDMTVNLMLSRSDDYAGGGTYFPSAETVVRLEFGEFLLHPGGLVHGGVNITQGDRVLMVMFVDEMK